MGIWGLSSFSYNIDVLIINYKGLQAAMFDVESMTSKTPKNNHKNIVLFQKINCVLVDFQLSAHFHWKNRGEDTIFPVFMEALLWLGFP